MRVLSARVLCLTSINRPGQARRDQSGRGREPGPLGQAPEEGTHTCDAPSCSVHPQHLLLVLNALAHAAGTQLV